MNSATIIPSITHAVQFPFVTNSSGPPPGMNANITSRKNIPIIITANHALLNCMNSTRLACTMKKLASMNEINNGTQGFSPSIPVFFSTANTTMNTSRNDIIGKKYVIADTDDSTAIFLFCSVVCFSCH